MQEKHDLRVSKTYGLLSQALMTMLTDMRFEDITVGCLCEKAMIRRTTFYRHFADKHDFLRYIIAQLCDKFSDRIPPDLNCHHTRESFICISRELARFVIENELLIYRMSEGNMLPLMLDMISEHISTAIEACFEQDRKRGGAFDEPPKVMAAFFSGGLVRIVRDKIAANEQLSENSIADTMVRIMYMMRQN